MAEIPTTVIECDGCGEDLNLLNPHLVVQVKAQRQVLVSEEIQSDDPNEVSEPNIYLGTKSGRGTAIRVHGRDCAIEWFENRTWKDAKLEFHHEDEIYVPKDNREPEELVASGDMPEEMLAVYAAQEGEN